ncbi:MAG: arylsulfotransferase family protein [Solirubrobacterales bacterium]
MRHRLLWLPAIAIAALAITVLAGAPQRAHAGPAERSVGFRAPTLFPRFSLAVHDYTVRCDDQPVSVNLHASGEWRIAIDRDPLRGGNARRTVPLSSGLTFTVSAKRVGYPRVHRFHVRCLPEDFPVYRYVHRGRAHPRYFSVDASFFIPFEERYSIIFDNHGVPVWWLRTPARGTRVLPGGDILWFNRPENQWEVHRLDGSLIRTLPGAGQSADLHDLQPTSDGGYLLGAYVTQSGVDTSAYGGSPTADVMNTELQQIGPSGDLVWDWKSQDHISLAETGRWWPHVIDTATEGYDIVHWNSIEPDGGSAVASFRNLDAVYKIKKSTGDIVWKLGGTTTPESLLVKGDPRRSTLGAQHDARVLPDGTLTVFDDRTDLANQAPRAVRYRINERDHTATLLDSITEPAMPASTCCGSARRLASGDWLVDWGRNPLKKGASDGIGGYAPDGGRTFFLSFRKTASYRAEPVPSGALTARSLRAGMRTMCRSGCG